MASKVDLTDVFRGLDKLGDAAHSVSRSMGVAAGQLVRDDAKARVGVKSGTLKAAIYLAYRDVESKENRVVYSVTWNAKKAPHGHLQEFGHWRYNVIINGKAQKSLLPGRTRGRGPDDHGGPGALEHPAWVAAQPFLRPAWDATKAKIQEVAVARGRKRLAEILAGTGAGETDEP